VEGGRLKARAAYGFFPAAAVGDDIEVYADSSRSAGSGRCTRCGSSRTRASRRRPRPWPTSWRPRGGARRLDRRLCRDRGPRADALVAGHEKAHDDYAAIMVKALADRLAEALAEWLHRKARADWGYGAGEKLSIEDLVREKYRGIRPRRATRPAPITPRSGSFSTSSEAKTGWASS